ncbi:hypothetical protein [Nocardiopsis oceani]
MNLKKKTTSKQVTGDVVATLQEQVRQAQALASVPEQKLLADPTLNPTTRGLADSLTAARLRTELELEHRRELRRAKEADRREERAARRAAAIDDAREATSNENVVLDMTRSRKRFTLGALGASLVCSVGSAMGVEAVAQAAGAASGLGYIAEVTMTGMATMAIAWRGGLARSNAFIKGLPVPVLNAMIVIPLIASVVASTAGSGLIGAVCSVGAALFAWMAYLISVTGAEAVTQAVKRMDIEAARAATLTATEVPAHTETPRASTLPRRTPGDGLEEVGEAIAEGAADFLRSHGDPSERSHETARSHGEIESPADTEDTEVSPSEHPSERPRSHGEDDRPLTAQEQRRLKGLENRRRVANHLYEHPDATHGEIADELGLGESTVRRIRKELDGGSTS